MIDPSMAGSENVVDNLASLVRMRVIADVIGELIVRLQCDSWKSMQTTWKTWCTTEQQTFSNALWSWKKNEPGRKYC